MTHMCVEKCGRVAVSVLLCWIASLPTIAQEAITEDPEVILFDGKSLEGWEGNLALFRLEDGAIVGGRMDKPIPNNEFLCAAGEWGDFELTLKVKIKGNANGGIQLRSQRIENPPHEMTGYQADMGWTFWGALYDESRRNKLLQAPDKALIERILKKDDWNDYRIRCEGPRIQLWLNGEQTVDYIEPDETIPRVGQIAVQIHGGAASECWYKDIVIRPLAAPTQSPATP